jgi:ABC-type transporter MlaC component
VKSLIEECKNDFKSIIVKEGIDESVGRVDLRLD